MIYKKQPRLSFPLKKAHLYLQNLSVGRFMLLMVLMTFITGFFLISIGLFFNLNLKQPITQSVETSNIVIALFTIGIVMPFLETLIFQTGVIELLQRKTALRNSTVILVSATAFSLAHYPYTSILFQLWVFSFGLILAYSYVIYKNKPQGPTGVAWAIHGLRNTISIFLVWM